jgi:hypothetical protein
MRYQNWDVLLFPGESRIPVQEFKTNCHVIPDQGARYISHSLSRFNTLAETLHQQNGVTLVPVTTSFVPSLTPASAFVVSIHSWEPPRSRSAPSIGQEIVFEARVCIDGRLAT